MRKIGKDVYAVQVGDNKILDRDHTQALAQGRRVARADRQRQNEIKNK